MPNSSKQLISAIDFDMSFFKEEFVSVYFIKNKVNTDPTIEETYGMPDA